MAEYVKGKVISVYVQGEREWVQVLSSSKRQDGNYSYSLIDFVNDSERRFEVGKVELVPIRRGFSRAQKIVHYLDKDGLEAS
jgi:hypothetical protein